MNLAYWRPRRCIVPQVHVIHEVWPSSNGSGHEVASWACKPTVVVGPIHRLEDVAEGMVACARCDVFGIQTVPEVVYLLDTGKTYKVGTTTQLTARVANLHAKLIAFTPGSYDLEREVITAMSDAAIRGREWFRREPDVLDRLLAFFPQERAA